MIKQNFKTRSNIGKLMRMIWGTKCADFKVHFIVGVKKFNKQLSCSKAQLKMTATVNKNQNCSK